MDYKCLMIDDDEIIAENTAEYFNAFDIKTAYVTSYENEVDFLAENTVSLLLLDINLGNNSGFELCKRIRNEYNMPILFISARTSDDDVLMALNIGGDGSLFYFLEHRGKVITKDEFLQNVWEDECVGEGTVAVHIRHLREKIEADPNEPKIIKTVWGVGYIMGEMS